MWEMDKKKTINRNKLVWFKTEITKIALNSEQAVLSCCDNSGKGISEVSWTPYSQCGGMCVGTGANAMAS